MYSQTYTLYPINITDRHDINSADALSISLSVCPSVDPWAGLHRKVWRIFTNFSRSVGINKQSVRLCLCLQWYHVTLSLCTRDCMPSRRDMSKLGTCNQLSPHMTSKCFLQRQNKSKKMTAVSYGLAEFWSLECLPVHYLYIAIFTTQCYSSKIAIGHWQIASPFYTNPPPFVVLISQHDER